MVAVKKVVQELNHENGIFHHKLAPYPIPKKKEGISLVGDFVLELISVESGFSKTYNILGSILGNFAMFQIIENYSLRIIDVDLSKKFINSYQKNSGEERLGIMYDIAGQIAFLFPTETSE